MNQAKQYQSINSIIAECRQICNSAYTKELAKKITESYVSFT